MTEHLSQYFEDFARGALTAADFERELLAVCKTTPDSTWNVLALLDQYHRRRKLSAELCRTVRHRIQRHALGIEKLETTLRAPVTARSDGIDRTAASTALPLVATQPAFAPVLPFRHLLAD